MLFENELESSSIKIIDFGLSVKFDKKKKMTQQVGTPYYVAPELLHGYYDQRVDVWSCGVMLYLMLAGQPPFIANSIDAVYEAIKKGILSFSEPVWNDISNECKDLIKSLLRVDVEKRISISAALQHRWFNDVNIERNREAKELITEELLHRLTNFVKRGRLQKEVMKMIVSTHKGLHEIKNLRKIFFYVDYLNNGAITFAELKVFLEEVGYNCTDKVIQTMIDEMWLKEEGIITYTDFCAALLDPKNLKNEKLVRNAFTRFDIDGNGSITADDIQKCFHRFGYEMFLEEIEEMINDFDLENDGHISYEEFLKRVTIMSGMS